MSVPAGHSLCIYIDLENEDFVCNWIGNERFVKALQWSGHDKFNAAEDRVWTVDGEIVGKTRSAAGLTFATVDGYTPCSLNARHMLIS